MSAGYVYVIQNSLNHHKVGYSRGLDRSDDIIAASPYPAHLEMSLYHKEATKIELVIHKMLDDTRLNGEWFSCGLERIKSAIPFATRVVEKKIATSGRKRRYYIPIIKKLGGKHVVRKMLESYGIKVKYKEMDQWHRDGKLPGEYYHIFLLEADKLRSYCTAEDFINVEKFKKAKVS